MSAFFFIEIDLMVLWRKNIKDGQHLVIRKTKLITLGFGENDIMKTKRETLEDSQILKKINTAYSWLNAET